MKKITNIHILTLFVFFTWTLITSCEEDDEAPIMMVMVSADAGMDQTVEPTDNVALDASGSSVTGGGLLTYNWELSSTPAGSNTSLTAAQTENASFIADVAGNYVVTLTITSGTESASDMVTVNAIEPQFIQADQMARPAINTVFVETASKDVFNTTIPSEMGAIFAGAFQTRLLALNPGYSTNVLGWDAATLAGALATDVLNSDLTTSTAFGALNGRSLTDDVITTELTLIFGGPNGTDNAGLSDDHVDANDKEFSVTFPYLAEPH